MLVAGQMSCSRAEQTGGAPQSSHCCACRHPRLCLLPLPACSPQVSQYLERLTGDLEAAAHPALDALTGKVRAARAAGCSPGCAALPACLQLLALSGSGAGAASG